MEEDQHVVPTPMMTDSEVTATVEPTPTPPVPSRSFFSRHEKAIGFWSVAGLFGVSMLGRYFEPFMYAWFLGVLAAILLCSSMLIVGVVMLFKHRKGAGNLIGNALYFFAVLALVGGGTCAVNLTSVHF